MTSPRLNVAHLAGATGFSRAMTGDFTDGLSLLEHSIDDAKSLSDRRLAGELYGYRARISYYHLLPQATMES